MNPSTMTPVDESTRGEERDVALDRRPKAAGMGARSFPDREDLLALGVVAAGFVVRLYVASRTYLNPDEALHYLLLNQTSAYLAYKASLTNAHPPLIYLVVYFWHFLGRSEVMLRFPSVVAGTAFCWFAYMWTAQVFGRSASWVALLLAAFLPSMIELSAELRAYALLLLGIGAALYFLERAFTEKSAREMWLFSAFLYLAILSHYSAVFFALAAGVYALARIADSHPPRKVVVAWAGGQVGALAICAFLYVTHLSKLKNSIAAWNTGFGTAYFHVDSTSLFQFTWQNTLGIFLFLFRERPVAVAMLLGFVATVAYFMARGLMASRGNPQSSRLGILLLFPFLGVWGAAIAGIYPYIGSRHTAFLAPFVIAAVSFLLAALCGQRLWAAILVAALVVTVSTTTHSSAPSEESAGNQSPALMSAAVSYMEQSIPKGDLILVDYQSSLPLAYYLCGPKYIVPIELFNGEYFEFQCQGYTVVSLHVWKLIAKSLPYQFEKTARSRGLKPGTRVWVYQTGWGTELGAELASQDAAFKCFKPNSFGTGVTVTPFVVGQDFTPQSPLGACQAPLSDSVDNPSLNP